MNTAVFTTCLCVMATTCLARACPAQDIHWVAGVRLGMSVPELMESRKGVANTTAFEQDAPVDPEKSSQLLGEALSGSPFFGHAFYDFKGGKLVEVALFSDYKKVADNLSRRRFLAAMTRRYGQPASIEVVDLDGEVAPALLWQKGNLYVASSCSPLDRPSRRGFLYLKTGRGKVSESRSGFTALPKSYPLRSRYITPVRALVNSVVRQGSRQ